MSQSARISSSASPLAGAVSHLLSCRERISTYKNKYFDVIAVKMVKYLRVKLNKRKSGTEKYVLLHC